MTRRSARQQSGQRAGQHDLRGHGDFVHDLLGVVVLQDRHGLLIDDVAGIGTRNHVMERGAGLKLTAAEWPS